MRLKLSLTCNYFNDQGLLPGSVVRYGVYVTPTGRLDNLGSPVVFNSPTTLVANIWPFLNRDADSVSQWIQPAGWVSLKNENPNTTVNYYGFFNDVKIYPQLRYSFDGFELQLNNNHYAYSNPINVCPATGSRINTLVCSNQAMVPAGQDFPCNILRTITSVGSDIGTAEIIVFPNPTNSIFSISGNTEGIYDLSVLSSDGKVVQQHAKLNSQVTQSFNIEKLPAGVYYLRIQTSNAVHHEKLVKN